MLAFHKAPSSDPDFYGYEYRVYEGNTAIGRVRVQYRPGMKNSKARNRWVGRTPWQFTIDGRGGTNGWSKGWSTRELAGQALLAEKKMREEGGGSDEAPPREEKKEAPRVDGFPKVKHCPNGHGSHTFNGPAEELLVTTCVTCGEALTLEKPDLNRSRFIGLPTMPDVYHEKLPAVVSALQAGRHVYLAGSAGTGKSEMGRQAAEVLGIGFHYIQCDSSMTRSALFGLIDANGTYHRTALREAFEFGGVFLLDEIDNGNPSLLAALNSAMANGFLTFPDGEVAAHEDFRVVATANTWGTGPTAEFVGRLRIDPATLDRFVRVTVPIDADLEDRLTMMAAGDDKDVAKAALKAVRAVRTRVESEGIKVMVTPRASMQTAALMIRGWSLRDALMTTALASLDEKRAADIMGGVVR